MTPTPLPENEKFNYQRAHQLLGTELLNIFTYVEPADINLLTFGHQPYQLFLRVCTEFEAASKLACRRTSLDATFVSQKGRPIPDNSWTIDQYKKLESLTIQQPDGGPNGKLSEFKFHLFNWKESRTFQPLSEFANANGPRFYKEYNEVKHNRTTAFPKANLENLINAYLALTALLHWQGVSINDPVILSCEGYHTGARFGYFWATSAQIAQEGDRYYF